MLYKLLIFLLVLSTSVLFGQELIWVHRPFSTNQLSPWRYAEDTVVFASNEEIGAIVYWPEATTAQPEMEMVIKNSLGKERTATFYLKSFDPSSLKWSTAIKRYYQFMLSSPHWYYLTITPEPSVIDARDGVAFLEVIYQGVHETKDHTVFVSYKKQGTTDYKHSQLSFKGGQGYFEPLWAKLTRYQTILDEQTTLVAQQNKLLEQFEPHGYNVIAGWADRLDGLDKNVQKKDLNFFQAVENLKIVTETLPSSVSRLQKRELHELLLLDVAIFETKDASQKAQKEKRKTALLQQLKLYPELQEVLKMYQNLTQSAVVEKEQENAYLNDYHRLARKYKPYDRQYKTYHNLQVQVEAKEVELKKFD